MKAIYRHGYDSDIEIDVEETREAFFRGVEYTEVVCSDGDVLPSTYSEISVDGVVVYGCAENF